MKVTRMMWLEEYIETAKQILDCAKFFGSPLVPQMEKELAAAEKELAALVEG